MPTTRRQAAAAVAPSPPVAGPQTPARVDPRPAVTPENVLSASPHPVPPSQTPAQSEPIVVEQSDNDEPAVAVQVRLPVTKLVKEFKENGKSYFVCVLSKPETPDDCRGKWSATAGSQKNRYQSHFAKFHPDVEVYDPTLAIANQPKLKFPDCSLDVLNEFCDMLAELGIAFSVLDNERFRKFMEKGYGFQPGRVPTRRQCPRLLEAQMNKHLAQLAIHFPSPTVCIDIGTVFKRYLLVTVVQGRKVLVVRAKDQKEMPNGRMTIDSVKETVNDVLVQLRKLGMVPVCVVADNASNVQGIAGRGNFELATDSEEEVEDVDDDEAAADEDEDEEEEEEEEPAAPTKEEQDLAVLVKIAKQVCDSNMLFVCRCAAHGVQLIVKDLQPLWQESLQIAKDYRDVNKSLSFPKFMEPKWNSAFQLILAVSRYGGPSAEPRAAPPLFASQLAQLQKSIGFLSVLNGATNFVQRDDATIFDTLCMLTSVTAEFTPEAHANDEEQRAAKLLKEKCHASVTRRTLDNFIGALHVVVLYFMPFFDLSQDVPLRIASLVRDTLFKVNPLCCADFDTWTRRPYPAAPTSTEADWESFENYVGRLLPKELRTTVLSIAQASATEASVERAFSEMKHVVNPARNRLKAKNVESTLVVSSAARLHKRLSMPEAEPRPDRTDVPLNLRVARRRNQKQFDKWATKVTKDFAQTLLGRWDDEKHDTHELSLVDRLRPRERPAVMCEVCNKRLDLHAVPKAYVKCGGFNGRCRANNTANVVCGRINRLLYKRECDAIEAVEADWRCKTCASLESEQQ